MGIRVYHLHIPRTSGTNILAEVEKIRAAHSSLPDGDEKKLKVYAARDAEVIFSKERTSAYNFISGHFATNPMVEIPDLRVFSLVRNPVDHFISCSAFRCTYTNRPFTLEELEKYVSGNYDKVESFPGFSGFPNPQANFLSAELFRLEEFAKNEQSSVFVGSPKTLDDVKPYIDEMIIGTLENRELLVERVNSVLKHFFGSKISNNKEKINSNPGIDFKIPKSIVEKIKERTWLDAEVYDYVKTKEKKYALNL